MRAPSPTPPYGGPPMMTAPTHAMAMRAMPPPHGVPLTGQCGPTGPMYAPAPSAPGSHGALAFPHGAPSPYNGVSHGLASVPQSAGGGTSAAIHSPMRGGAQGNGAGRWQEAYLELEQEKRRIQNELRTATEEANRLIREAQGLRDQISAERQTRQERGAELAKQVEDLERENKQLNMRLVKVQMQDAAKLTDVTMIKKDVVGRTMELEKLLREFQQTHQDKLFSRMWSITSGLQNNCQKADAALQIKTPVDTAESLTPSVSGNMLRARSPSPSEAQPTQGEFAGGGNSTGTFLDPETQQALKRRLQSLGDVVVYSNDKFEACCASGRAIPPGALRVRPRRCDHIFLVECLMPYWAEGLCPVCRCSFAYDRPHDAGFDESDKYSSVSTSVSQMHRVPGRSTSNSDLGVYRGPRSNDARGRSASLSRKGRRRKGLGGEDMLSEASGMGAGFASRLPADLSLSPARSVASLRSRASSLPRDREADRPPGSPMPQSAVSLGIAPQSPTVASNRPL